ncbi:hypothetical protein QPL79_01345 [Ignisphaera sp. 4213-co]|uniref:Uncharacterized protein n=1 Tax=Ignisphaera cupida TaxID=3050454 RepID=A0ABD4Z4D4_9CREN|nr:hypothetical protein [Ignisphaera sp. 4213-co]MDK6028010.1 hypothetical protein [Ignisphaera sp. 4213-co]
MYRVNIEKKYIVKKGEKRIVVELCRSQDGKLYAVPVLVTKHVYTLPDGTQKEWEYQERDAEEIDYMSLPKNIRDALSKIDI